MLNKKGPRIETWDITQTISVNRWNLDSIHNWADYVFRCF